MQKINDVELNKKILHVSKYSYVNNLVSSLMFTLAVLYLCGVFGVLL